MAKQMITGAMEDWLGEYILNISKENIKVAAIRGKIKLDNVQLDGDLIGSHVLGAVGLSGFGVLSCWARSLRVSVNWKNLEKEPTRFEIRGVHLVCVPLLPSTATRMYGSGTAVDPRCTLRTRAKRSALARFERNFFSRRIPGEGLPRNIAPSGEASSNALPTGNDTTSGKRPRSWKQTGQSEYDEALAELTGLDESMHWSEEDLGENETQESSARTTEARKTWRAKLRARIFRNMEMVVNDIHIRCEVPEGALEVKLDTGTSIPQSVPYSRERKDLPANRRSFALGVTLDSFAIKTANQRFETGNITFEQSSISSSKTKGSDVPDLNEGADGRRYKVIEVTNLAMYWDDTPPMLISESYFLKSENSTSIAPHKIQARVSAAMEAMQSYQDPGDEIRFSLASPEAANSPKPRKSASRISNGKHQFCCAPLSFQIRTTLSEINAPVQTCLAELMPCRLDLDFQPHQYAQYGALRNAIFSQQRFDTMLHKRPVNRPDQDPRAWWRYVIACVITRPNTRPWRDVLKIVRSRPRYIELVTKKVWRAREGNGFHGGLSEKESSELLSLEELLPIEALLSFHLVALRKVLELQMAAAMSEERRGGRDKPTSMRSPIRPSLKSSRSINLIRKKFTGGSTRSRKESIGTEEEAPESQLLKPVNLFELEQDSSLVPDNMHTRLDSKEGNIESRPFQLSFKVHDASAAARLLDGQSGVPILRMDIKTSGIARLLAGVKSELTFDIKSFEIFDTLHPSLLDPSGLESSAGKILSVAVPSKDDSVGAHDLSQPELGPNTNGHGKENRRTFNGSEANIINEDDDFFLNRGDRDENDVFQDGGSADNHKMCLPPSGVVCRVFASRNQTGLALSVSAHPATLVWNKPCFDAISIFFSSPAPQMRGVLQGQLRNAATPLAHRAQLALMSPTSLYMRVNVNAPKVWIPVSSNSRDGALFLDAGKFKLVGSKPVGITDTDWELETSDIQVNFVRGVSGLFRPSHDRNGNSTFSDNRDMSCRQDISVVRPFNVVITANIVGEKEIVGSSKDTVETEKTGVMNGSGLELYHSQTRSKISISVGAIYLNLVDVNVLAKAIGKWYAAEVVRVKETRRSKDHSDSVSNALFMTNKILEAREDGIVQRLDSISNSFTYEVNVLVEKVQMALEGYSEKPTTDVFSENSPPQKRTYLAEVGALTVQRIKNASQTITRFAVGDASIAQMKKDLSLDKLIPSNEPHHQILTRAVTYQFDEDDVMGASSPNEHAFSPPHTPKRSPDKIVNSEYASMHQTPNTPMATSSFGTPLGFPPTRSPSVLSASHLHNIENHLHEVEIDVESLVVRVTPTSLRDCAQVLQRILELIELMTKEMERKVHQEGRMARKRTEKARVVSLREMNPDETQDHADVLSPAGSTVSEGYFSPNQVPVSDTLTDSSILFKVNLKDNILLAGRPPISGDISLARSVDSNQDETFIDSDGAVIQVLSNILIMFQSIENPDASGTKTIHISIDDLSASINTKFEHVPLSEVPPMIGPTAGEFRAVYATENLGCVVSQEFSLDCDSIKSCLTPNDMHVLTHIARKMVDRLLRSIRDKNEHNNDVDFELKKLSLEASANKPTPAPFASSFIRYQKKGSGIATHVRIEIQSFSFVLLRAFRSKHGARPLFDFYADNLKGKLEGCMSALSGEFSAILSVHFFNSDIANWEYAIEPVNLVISVEQMPNELVLSMVTEDKLNVNLTGVILSDATEMEFDLFGRQRLKLKENQDVDPAVLTPSAMSTVGLRRATESHSVSLVNQTGLDILICPMGFVTTISSTGKRELDNTQPSCFMVKDGSKVSLDSCFGGGELQKMSDLISHAFPALALSLSPTAEAKVGKREAIFDLPVTCTGRKSIGLHKLRPFTPDRLKSDSIKQDRRHVARTSETILSNGSLSIQGQYSYYDIEPVVEWCMQNQRLRSSTSDVYNIANGKDLISSNVWSPGDEFYNEAENSNISSTKSGGSSNWLRPYLQNDSPEWTDMTCILRMERERVMLPDDNWIWANDWMVDLSGTYSESTDADGWEYEGDFETFNRSSRFYEKGDACRRRRWTRMRMIKPPHLDDPHRTLPLVWETVREEKGNFSVTVRSPVIVHNKSNMALSFFLFSHSWKEDVHAGATNSGETLPIPITLASATYMRIAKKRNTNDAPGLLQSIGDYECTDRLVILPTSYTSSVILRASLLWNEENSELTSIDTGPRISKLHFLVHIKSKNGVTDIYVEPMIRIINLLPCQLQYQLGEIIRPEGQQRRDSRPVFGKGRKKVSNKTIAVIDIGKEDCSSAVDPALKPHISLRVPGYQWSPWQRIVNRKAQSHTWVPNEEEEDNLFETNTDDHVEEYKTCVRFERLKDGGDPLILILSVEVGHCPTIRIYSQYWIIDKTGFGCRFTEGFSDMLSSVPSSETCRRSYHIPDEARHSGMKMDAELPGHQWSIGMSGMSLFFSRKEKITLSIESGAGTDPKSSDNTKQIRSKWISPVDVSNVMPKAVFHVDQKDGPRRFELSLSVSIAPSIFSRTKCITLFPRYQIVNLLDKGLYVSQNGCTSSEVFIPSQRSVPFHWEMSSLPPKVRLCSSLDDYEFKQPGTSDRAWTNGCIQLDKIGITSMRLPTTSRRPGKPIVIQAEVRLAAKDQSSAVVVVIWSANEKSNPLYLLRNKTKHPILCSQVLYAETNEEDKQVEDLLGFDKCSAGAQTDDQKSWRKIGMSKMKAKQSRDSSSVQQKKEETGFEFPRFNCGTTCRPSTPDFIGSQSSGGFVWSIKSGEEVCFGFDDPEKPHILEWTCGDIKARPATFDEEDSAVLEIDAMGQMSYLTLPNGKQVKCHICAEHSTKVIEFIDVKRQGEATGVSLLEEWHQKDNRVESMMATQRHQVRWAGSFEEDVGDDEVGDDDVVAFSVRMDLPFVTISVVDNCADVSSGREILYVQLDSWMMEFSQSREGYHELEWRLMSLQVDNHIHKSVHPVLIFCPRLDENEPFLHLSAVRRLQPHSATYVFRYAALRILDVQIFLDRRTAETIARFLQPLRKVREENNDDPQTWIKNTTMKMAAAYANPNRRAPRDIEKIVLTANSGRIYFEQLHLHPIRLSLTFTQEWMEWNPATEGVMIFQFIRGMASIANAPLTFTSFVVGHVFESPQALFRIVSAHYSSQLTKQIFAILGSLAILEAPADFLANIGTGVRDFFYEPINGMVHGPAQFIEGLEAGTQSLARGVFVGVVRGAANVTNAFNSNLAGLTADDDFIDERKAHQRMLTDAISRGMHDRTISDSLYLAGASVARGVRSGAMGILEQPSLYASKHGPVGFVKGIGKALVGAIIKPVVGVGDAAVLVMNHVTSDGMVLLKIPKRLRRALPRASSDQPHSVQLVLYDERAAKAQKIVTAGESVDDAYIGHVNIPGYLMIASEQCLWAIDRHTRDSWCVSWEEISHFGMVDNNAMKVTVFSQTGLKSHVFQVDSAVSLAELYHLLGMHIGKMGNCSTNLSELDNSMFSGGLENISKYQIPGIKAKQVNHVFGSCNRKFKRMSSSVKDEIDVIEQCFARVKILGSGSPTFFKTLDEEAWTLVSSWGQVFSGLSSRRCIAASIINGTGHDIQIKSTKLIEGGSPCYTISTKEFDQEQGILRPGGAIIFFGWGVVPSLLQPGQVFMNIETNTFACELSDQKSSATFATPVSGYQVGFLEKSYDESGWWAKYWLLVRTVRG